MVINIGFLKEGRYTEVKDEIAQIKKACQGKILKVIVETCYLTEAEIKIVTQLVDQAGADFIKTSTGFGTRGASYRDIELFKENSNRLLIKAAGGIRDQESAYKYIRGGVTRIGTSSGIDLVRGEKRSTMNTY